MLVVTPIKLCKGKLEIILRAVNTFNTRALKRSEMFRPRRVCPDAK